MDISVPTNIQNPILPGFNPDPSIVRVDDDYYIATSTFEWYPGVQIHHSKDLVNWRLVSHPLNRSDLLEMTGNPDSCGIWAPCLSYHDGLFHLVYTDVKRFDGIKDPHNYLTTCATVDGEWSAPVYLNSSGFDPSLFHDDDGRKWLVNMVWDYRPNHNPFGGIFLQEYSASEQKLIGPVTNIFRGTEMGLTEAPHLYKRNGYYYLLTAEGGTGYDHVMTMARSRSLSGPYEVDPAGYLLTAKDNPELELQRAGHGDFVETPDGEVYVVHLCGRPINQTDMRRCPMGRETGIQPAYWTDDGWLRLSNGGNQPDLTVAGPKIDLHPWPATPVRTEFVEPTLPIDFQWLRTSFTEPLFSLQDRPGFLRLYGRESLGSLFQQSIVARRQQAFVFKAATKIEFQPTSFLQLAGLVNYYNAHKYHYLYITLNDHGQRVLAIMSCEGDPSQDFVFPLSGAENGAAVVENGEVVLPDQGAIYLQCSVNYGSLVYAWSQDGENWQELPLQLDYSVVSDEAGKGEGESFTGAFVGMCCQDLAGSGLPADFEFFDYQEFGE
ncbi:glycoside hydrolase family 43 protein [Arenicella xantha]|uniref:Xylan 1,4-beta-xylosidase n=1 Tax=Arenicella xantha TaxID=644221 RepID=A0A395JMM2_9GAMM|nr:glycoside hydrolase family 43 protein [Arenicella xantha]RBP51675.1 xylan 1,4-beta-xylosidase [Arenicella xantha]